MISQLQNIVDHLPGMIYISDNATRTVQWCNKYFEEETGYSLREMNAMGIEFFKLIMHPDDFPLALKARSHFMEDQGEVKCFCGVCRIKAKNDEKWKWVNGIAIPYDYDGASRVKEVICNVVRVYPQADTLLQVRLLFRNILKSIHAKEIGKLTTREKEVIRLAIKGDSIKMIAEKLNIESCTVEFHLQKIRQNMNVPNMASLVSKAIELGF